MAESQAKYHHLIPQTYMAAWAHGNGTLYVNYLDDERIAERNKANISGINHYHSIVAGMVICTKEDADILFAPVSQYDVKYEGKIISDTLELNRIYYDFENWEITRADGSLVSRRKIKGEIDNIKIRDIEINWSEKYEDKWDLIRKQIELKILFAKTDSVPAFEREYLMKFYTALDWRSIKSNIQFDDAVKWLCKDVMQLDEIDIPKEERFLNMLDNAADEMRHCLLLKFYRQYLNDEGIIYKNAMANLQYTSFHFLVADGDVTFNTNDNPAFTYTREDGKLMGLLPITPNILMCQGKATEDDGNYYITHVTEEAVKKYNRAIQENANEFIIMGKK
ncbi:MAG: DUF4238 domain-containing protein [Syntrophomonadaceae bacterium]|jgi:hypothetical protein|nr:DUF4238 domain-containing protein [Syntrophomonadaceae bacterium]